MRQQRPLRARAGAQRVQGVLPDSLLWLVFNLLFPKMSTYTHTKSARINSHVTAAEESALAVFFGQKNSHLLRRALSSKITIILCNLGHKRTVTDSQSKPRAAPVGSACGLKLCAVCRTVQVRIRVNEYTPAHAEQGTLNNACDLRYRRPRPPFERLALARLVDLLLRSLLTYYE